MSRPRRIDEEVVRSFRACCRCGEWFASDTVEGGDDTRCSACVSEIEWTVNEDRDLRFSPEWAVERVKPRDTPVTGERRVGKVPVRLPEGDRMQRMNADRTDLVGARAS